MQLKFWGHRPLVTLSSLSADHHPRACADVRKTLYVHKFKDLREREKKNMRMCVSRMNSNEKSRWLWSGTECYLHLYSAFRKVRVIGHSNMLKSGVEASASYQDGFSKAWPEGVQGKLTVKTSTLNPKNPSCLLYGCPEKGAMRRSPKNWEKEGSSDAPPPLNVFSHWIRTLHYKQL